MRLTVAALLALVPLLSVGQTEDWAVGKVGRVIAEGSSKGVLCASLQSARRFAVAISPEGEKLSKAEKTKLRAACNADILSGTYGYIAPWDRVGILSISPLEAGDTDSWAPLKIACVKVQSGPLKGQTWFTPWVQFDDHFFTGETVVISSDTRKVAAAFDKDSLFSFNKAMYEKDRAVAGGLVNLQRVVLLNEGTFGTVSDDPTGRTVRIRVETGKYVGSLVYVIKDDIDPGYDTLKKYTPKKKH